MLVSILLGAVLGAVVKIYTNEHRSQINRFKRRASDVWGLVAILLIIFWVLSHGS